MNSTIYPSQIPTLAIQRPATLGNAATGGLDLGFKDVLDTINPLQQLPVISSLYRGATGDTISTFSRLAGGALFGGPVGFLASAFNVGLEAVTGDDIAGNLFALFDGPTTTPAKGASVYASMAAKLTANA